MDPSQWKFLRMRPANFPGLRIAQFASLLYHRHNLFSSLIEAADYPALKALLSVSQSAYWTKHYHFGICAKNDLHLGEDSIGNLIINTVVPLLAAWSRFRDDAAFMDQALAILQKGDAESNTITRRWMALGIPNQTAADSQGLLELYHHFCSTRRCLDCTIGSQLIRPT
jgi:hypothetical protein